MTAQNLPIFAGFALLALILIGYGLVCLAAKTKRKPFAATASIPMDFSNLPMDKRLVCQFAGVLLHSRLKQRLTRRELANKVGVPVRVISSMENANPHTLKFLCRVAETLNCDIAIIDNRGEI
jgi:hypothetical protein